MEWLQSNMIYKRRQGHRQQEDDRVKTSALTAVMCPQTQKCLGLPEAGRDRKDSLLQIVGFSLPELRQYIHVFISPGVPQFVTATLILKNDFSQLLSF